MRPMLPLLPLLALLSGVGAEPPPVGESTIYARRAAAMLGPEIWKQVIVIPCPKQTSRYPRSLGAVVFEFGGVLWFYTATEGTQSLSTQYGHAELDKRDFSLLLLRLDPGFAHWEPDYGAGPHDAVGPTPPNACFLECIVLLRQLAASGTVSEARLLSYYISVPGGVHGHTVLFFRTSKGPMVADPHFPKERFRIRTAQCGDPKRVADDLRPDVVSARWVPTA